MKPILDAAHELGGAVRLLNVSVRARRDGLQAKVVDGEVRVQKHQRVQVLTHPRQDFGNRVARKGGHGDVEQNDVRLVAQDDGDRTGGFVAGDDLVASALERLFYQLEDCVTLIDDEYGLHHITPS